MIIRSFSVALLLIFVGCRSTPLRAPAVAPIDADSQWLKDYKSAREQHDTNAACETFKRLAADNKFPAHDMAQLRAMEVCPSEQIEGFNRAQLPAYLQDLAVDVLLKHAAHDGNKAAELDLALEKSKMKLPQTEKVKWMNLALQRAQELQLMDRLPELNARLYSLSPRLNPEPTEKQYLAVAGDLRLARLFDKARQFYEKVIRSKTYDTEDKITAFKGIRLTYKNARQNEAHLAASQRLIDFLKNTTRAHFQSHALMLAKFDAQIYRGRALWTMGQVKEATAVFTQLEKRMKGKVSLAELYWLKGRMSEETNDFASVSKYMDLARKERLNDGELRDKIMWYSAWNERRQGHFPRAIEAFSEIDKKTLTEFTRQRALFWLAMSYSDNHQEAEAKQTFTRLVELDPLGYYGLMAHRQLGLPITLQKPTPDATKDIAAKIPMDATVAEWLNTLGEKDALTALLDQTSQAYRKQKDQSDEGWVTIFKYYAKAGLYMKLYESLTTLTPDQRKGIFENHPELLFPQPWNDDVHAAATQFGVEEDLIYSIIRQESAFDPHARSLADAFGLMQLLPEVAEHLKDKYKIPYAGMDDLYDPKTNVSFGAAHLKELFQRHNGKFILAVASYNASENVIRNWMKTRFHGDALEFIEEIPYEETRAYVRLVMRNLIFYNLLKSQSSSIEFPAWVLNLQE